LRGLGFEREVPVKRFLGAGAVLFLFGCTTTYSRPAGLVPVVPGSIEAFDALVASSTGAPACEAPELPWVGPGERAVALVYRNAIRQQVTVLIDEAGAPKAYLDVRTELSDDGAGDRTAIALYLNEGYAVLGNHPRVGRPSILEVPLEQAFSSERLGNPSAMLQRVLSACGGNV
jgi:hypothetical protein